DEVRAAHRVDGVDGAALVEDDLLRAHGKAGGLVAWQRDGFVHRVGMERLGAADNGCHRLDSYADEVHFGLLLGERYAGGLRVEPHEPGARVLGAEALAHLTGPDT